MRKNKRALVIFTIIIDIVVTFVLFQIPWVNVDFLIPSMCIYVAIILGSLILINMSKVCIWADCIVVVLVILYVILLFFEPNLISNTINTAKRNYYISQQEKAFSNVEHYEIEFYRDEIYPNEVDEYTELINKYSVPQIITIKDLKNEFPIENAKLRPYSIEYEDIPLDNDDERVYVLVSVSREFTLEEVLFVYDELSLTSDGISIRTDFKMIDDLSGCVGKYSLIVVSIIPVEQ